MGMTIFAYGHNIYTAAVEGKKRGYKACIKDEMAFKETLEQYFKFMLSFAANDAERARVIKNTRNHWAFSALQLNFRDASNAVINGKREEFVRVFFMHGYRDCCSFDITRRHWDELSRMSAKIVVGKGSAGKRLSYTL